MNAISVYEAKANLSKYINLVSDGEVDNVIITKNGSPVVKIVPYNKDVSKRIGIAKGKLKEMTISLDEFNDIPTGYFFKNDEGLF